MFSRRSSGSASAVHLEFAEVIREEQHAVVGEQARAGADEVGVIALDVEVALGCPSSWRRSAARRNQIEALAARGARHCVDVAR